MLTYEQMIDHLETVEQTMTDFCDDNDDLVAVLIEQIDQSLFRGSITSEIHNKLYWHFGLDI